MAFCYYGNAWATTPTTTTSTSDILWMGCGGINATTTTCTSTATSDCYMWVGGAQAFNLQQMQAGQQQMQNAQNQDDYQRASHEALQREIQLRQEAEQQRTQPARDRAKELLLANLTPAQKETLEKNKWFLVEGGRSKQRYRIRVGSVSGNIDVMDGDKVRHRLCAHLNQTIGIPSDDHILAQKLMLEAAEDDFLRTANVHRV